MMVRPCTFDFNPQTSESNRFQARPDSRKGDAHTQAQAEFDGLAAALQSAGVAVHAFTDRVEPLCPDAVFPNNWVSLHADGTVVLYPMLAPNRRLERRLDELVGAVGQLKEENRALRQRQDALSAERATLLAKNEQVRARVEAMIGRLKSMESGA